MFILLALIFAAVAGIVLHFVLPGRDTRGTALASLLATALAALVYAVLTWTGIGEGNLWLWVVSLTVPAAITAVAVWLLSRRRAAHDAREAARLRIA